MLVAAASAGGGGVFVGGAVGLLGALVFGIGGAAYDVRLLRFVAVGMALAVSGRERGGGGRGGLPVMHTFLYSLGTLHARGSVQVLPAAYSGSTFLLVEAYSKVGRRSSWPCPWRLPRRA